MKDLLFVAITVGFFAIVMDLRQGRRAALRRLTMSLDYGLGAVLALVLTGYLFYALVRPERF